jgi:hypothetical protein
MMPQWRADDEALTLVAERFPGFDHPACLVKIVSLNGLYGTNLYALHRMANHVVAVLAKKDVRTTSVRLVEDIAFLPKTPTAQKQGKSP